MVKALQSMMVLIRHLMKSKIYLIIFLLIVVLLSRFIGENLIDSKLTGIERRIQIRWIWIGILYGGLMVYVIGVVIYKAWKKDADQ